MEKLSRRRQKELETAARNRRELIAARLTRSDLLKLGLLTSAGYLIRKRGLSARAFAGDLRKSGETLPSPPTRAFIEPLPIMPIKQPVAGLNPLPTVSPNTAQGEGRTRAHQLPPPLTFPPQKLYHVVQKVAKVRMSPDLPLQTIWGFDGITPGPTYVEKYGVPVLVRNVNNLPQDNGGFGLNSVTTHLHNAHTGSESDGFAFDFFERGQFYDQHYANILAGFTDPQFAPTGDPREAMSTLRYHDHRVDWTSQNVYKGLQGFYLLFNDFDTGDETTGFHLPAFPAFDIPMIFTDAVFAPDTGLLFFDLFDLDGIVGDKFLVNGKIQPFFQVSPRRYRLRWANGSLSRFYLFFLTDFNNLSKPISFWLIANDGNLLPKPVAVTTFGIGAAERGDVIIDFSKFAGKSIYLENRWRQEEGAGRGGHLGPAGGGDLVLRFDVVLPQVADNSQDPATITKFYDLPPAPRTDAVVTRKFVFDQGNGPWTINGKLVDPAPRFRVKQNTAEIWVLQNDSGLWRHPIHNHFEEFQVLSRNRQPVREGSVERSRKDVVRLMFDEQIEIFQRFRDFLGRFVLHCHNTVHEDHAMMLVWEIDTVGDKNATP